MVRKTNLIIAAIIAFAMMALTGCPEADLSNVGATVGVESIDAPTITTSEVRGNSVYLSWTPVNNASHYVIFRSEKNDKGKFVKEMNVGTVPAPKNSFVESVNLDKSSIANDKTYQYRVVAYSAKTSLDGSEAKKKVDVTGLKAKGEKVAAATNLKAEVDNNGYIIFTFDAEAPIANITYTYAVEGDLQDYDGYTMFGTFSASYDDGQWKSDDPIFGNQKIAYTITTSWTDGYYAANTATATYEIPSEDIQVPNMSNPNVTNDGIMITFSADNRYKDATFKLYRAETGKDSYTFTEITSTFDKTEPDECDEYYDSMSTYYSYLDKSVETGKSYRYVLTGSIGDKALKYNASAVKNVTYNLTYTDNWFRTQSNFQVLNHNDGTVDISFNVQEGWTYTIERCLINWSVVEHTETDVKKILSTEAAPINDVKVVRDTITKTPDDNSYYKYTLIGEKDGITKKVSNYDYITYSTVVIGGDYDLYDTYVYGDQSVDLTIKLAKALDRSTLKFYRAEMKADGTIYNPETYQYEPNYKYVTEFEELKLGESIVYDNSYDPGAAYTYKYYYYKDITKKNVGSYYRYSATVDYNEETLNCGYATTDEIY